jgi:uncharacterized membrane protein
MLKPHYFFLIVGFIFGTFFLGLTPPFQVPDEVNHFYRAYHIAEGHLQATKQDNRLGGYMPKSLIKVIHTNLGIKGSPFTKTSFKNIKEQIALKIEDNTPVFVDFPNTALYTPLSYLPQALTIAVLKPLGVTPVKILYTTRFIMLLLWLATVFYALKNMVVFPWFFTVLALLPMCVFINMSVSADVVTNILGFLWIGKVFSLAFGEKNVATKDIIILFIIALLLASAKYVYTPSVFLVFLIPSSKYPNARFSKVFTLNSTLIFLAFVVAFIGSSYASKTYISNAAYNQAHVAGLDLPYGADINGQINHLKAHPKKIGSVVFKAFKASFSMLQNTYIGVLGWLDVRIPQVLMYLAYLSLLLVLLYENHLYKPKIHYKQRALLFFTGILLMFLIYLSQYLSWVGVGSDYCGSIQGRYFITVLPLVFLGLIFMPIKQRILLPLALGMAVIVLLGASQSLYTRYYAFPNKYPEIICDAEATWTDEYMGEIYFKSNISDVMIFNGSTISAEKARSGSHSSKVTTQNPYGATLRLYNYAVGDTLQAEVWYHGEGGTLWMTSAAHDGYFAQNKVVETDLSGWKKLTQTLIIDKILSEDEIGVFVESQHLCYFDDLKITVRSAR